MLKINKKIIIIVIVVLVVGVIAWDVFRSGNDIRNNGVTVPGVESQLQSIEVQQSEVTNSIGGIENRLRDSQSTANSITSELTEARTANTRILERCNTIQEIIDSNARAIESSERIFSDITKRGEIKN